MVHCLAMVRANYAMEREERYAFQNAIRSGNGAVVSRVDGHSMCEIRDVGVVRMRGKADDSYAFVSCLVGKEQ